jgi:hypothetical protein
VDEAQKVINAKGNIPTSESFRIVKNYMHTSKLVSCMLFTVICFFTATYETEALSFSVFLLSLGGETESTWYVGH